MKPLFWLLVILLILLFVCTYRGTTENFMNATQICNIGCFSEYTNDLNEAKDKCKAEFPYPDDQQKCIEKSPAYITSKACQNDCFGKVPIPNDTCLKGCHYLYDIGLAAVTARCRAEYPNNAEAIQKCIEATPEYQGNTQCVETCDLL